MQTFLVKLNYKQRSRLFIGHGWNSCSWHLGRREKAAIRPDSMLSFREPTSAPYGSPCQCGIPVLDADWPAMTPANGGIWSGRRASYEQMSGGVPTMPQPCAAAQAARKNSARATSWRSRCRSRTTRRHGLSYIRSFLWARWSCPVYSTRTGAVET